MSLRLDHAVSLKDLLIKFESNHRVVLDCFIELMSNEPWDNNDLLYMLNWAKDKVINTDVITAIQTVINEYTLDVE